MNNILSPISIVASYEYKEPVAGCGSKPCPIIDMYQSKSLSTQVSFAHIKCQAPVLINNINLVIFSIIIIIIIIISLV